MIAKVFNQSGQFVREYTEEIHGSRYNELAEQFAGKIGGRVVSDKPVVAEQEPETQEPADTEQDEQDEQGEVDYNDYTVAELKALLDKKDITYPSSAKKADLIAFLEA